MNTPITNPETLEAARYYAPNSERLQKAWLYGHANGKPCAGMSTWERTAAWHGARRNPANKETISAKTELYP